MEKYIDLLKDIFMLKFLPQLNENTGYAVIFLFGFLTSFHCIAMCGGFTISQIVGKDSNFKIRKCLLYNIFRVISYSVVGALAGGLGNIIAFTGKMQGIVPIIGGVFMIINGVNLFGVFKYIRRFSIRTPSIIVKCITNKNMNGPVFLGIISALMPCAPLQIVQLYALGTKSAVSGALAMLWFSIGTVPMLFMFGIINSFINKNYTNKIVKISAVIVFILGISLINRGLMYFNVMLHMPVINSESKNDDEYIESALDGDFQVVIMNLEKDRFSKIKVHKNIPVKWIIKVKEENLNECNNEIIIRDLDISKKLEIGENTIEFVPEEEGEIMYSCWMNMIKSKIEVVK